MRRLLFFVLFAVSTLQATEQTPEYLKCGNQNLIVHGTASPLFQYFKEHNIAGQFQFISTANYRGFVGQWEIKDSALFINHLTIREKQYAPSSFTIVSDSHEIKTDSTQVFADWYSGVIEGLQHRYGTNVDKSYSYFFWIKKGRLIDSCRIATKSLWQIKFDSVDAKVLLTKHQLKLYKLYDQFYEPFIPVKDTLFINKNLKGTCHSSSGKNPLLQYYHNDFSQWPYNWENLEIHGQPVSCWKVSSDSLFLTTVRLEYETGLFKTDKRWISLSNLFPEKVRNDKVFANWVSDILVVKHIKDVTYSDIPKDSKQVVTAFTLYKVEKGLIVSSYYHPKNADMTALPDTIDKDLKEILVSLYL